MLRAQATAAIAAAKQTKNLRYSQIESAVGRHPVWTTAALLGQQSMSAEEAQCVTDLLGLDTEVAQALQECPLKGALATAVPVDPLLYRFHEILQVYGTTIKALIHEEFGDGIMSAIDFEMQIERVADPKGDRVKITYNGKFLPYRKW